MLRAMANKQKLTSLTVTRLRPAAKPYLVWDNYQRGLALQIQPSGYRSFKLIYRHRNRPRWYHIGAADAIALADARRMAAELMLEIIRGKDPAAEKRAKRGASTFAQLHERYRDQHAKKRNKSWKQADALIRRYVLPRWGTLPADAITRTGHQGTDAEHGRSADRREPDIGCDKRDLHVGGEGRNPFGQSVSPCGAQSDDEQGARAECQ